MFFFQFFIHFYFSLAQPFRLARAAATNLTTTYQPRATRLEVSITPGRHWRFLFFFFFLGLPIIALPFSSFPSLSPRFILASEGVAAGPSGLPQEGGAPSARIVLPDSARQRRLRDRHTAMQRAAVSTHENVYEFVLQSVSDGIGNLTGAQNDILVRFCWRFCLDALLRLFPGFLCGCWCGETRTHHVTARATCCDQPHTTHHTPPTT